jgi:hypothetical protein
MYDRRKGVQGETQALRCAPPSLSIDAHSSIFGYETLFFGNFYQQCRKVNSLSFQCPCGIVVTRTLKMEAANTSVLLVTIYKSTWLHTQKTRISSTQL